MVRSHAAPHPFKPIAVAALLAAWAGLPDGRAGAATVTRAVNVTLNAANLDGYALDLNLDGTNDFTFTAAYAPDPVLSVGFDTIDIPFASGNGTVIDAATGDGFPASSRLAPGASVGPTRTFSSVNDQSNLYSFDSLNGRPATSTARPAMSAFASTRRPARGTASRR